MFGWSKHTQQNENTWKENVITLKENIETIWRNVPGLGLSESAKRNFSRLGELRKRDTHKMFLTARKLCIYLEYYSFWVV